MWTEISQQISQATGQDFTIADRQSVSGGCINQGYRVRSKQAQYFVKLNDADKAGDVCRRGARIKTDAGNSDDYCTTGDLLGNSRGQ